ncbi:PREDICTED: uncharacterized protein LOC104597999 isoform X3 [Nelumbo nucifera]|uniref:Uncharacterized protein LOC104597999 isoform X3 n=1 Tax=Nelumbo nucifera TaxID=4432 RepID=A0A1U7ZWQ8_NELNU|nr:PREDICTED: uncharacterized protein LOC104597999 isoform X3 [Nelumbo nucifera]
MSPKKNKEPKRKRRLKTLGSILGQRNRMLRIQMMNLKRKSKHVQYWNDYNRADRAHPQARSYSFQSSTVTYGGANGAYYTSSTTRRTGSDGVTVDENREADTTTGRATHKVSRGLHDKVGGTCIRIGGIAKGSGMIHPNMATMLGVNH